LGEHSHIDLKDPFQKAFQIIISSRAIEEEREVAGIAERTGKRARKALNAATNRTGFGPNLVWYLGLPGASGPPFDTPNQEKSIECPPSLYTTDGTLWAGEHKPDGLTELRAQVTGAWEDAGLVTTLAL